MRIELETNKKDDDLSYLSPATVMTEDGEKVINPTKGMTPKQKLSYFATYYLPKIAFGLVMAAIAFGFAALTIFKHEPEVNIIFVNHHMTDTSLVAETLYPYLEENGIKKQSKNININAACNIDLSDFGTYESKNTFDALIASRDYSLLFIDEENFNLCADATYFRYLNEFLTDDEISSYGEENILTGYDDLTGERYVCGLKLNRENCPWLSETNYEECCVGILFSDVESEKIKPLLQYILNYRSGE